MELQYESKIMIKHLIYLKKAMLICDDIESSSGKVVCLEDLGDYLYRAWTVGAKHIVTFKIKSKEMYDNK